MPTYDYKCPTCDQRAAVTQSMREYGSNPFRPSCPDHGTMERYLCVAPGFSGLANALAGDRHYDGMQAPDGSDISSRTKHREYMKKNGLTTADDYSQTWAKKQAERETYRQAAHADKTLRTDIAEQVYKGV